MSKVSKQELLELFAQYQYEKYAGVIGAITNIQLSLPMLYGEGVEIPKGMIETLMEEIVKLDLSPEREA